MKNETHLHIPQPCNEDWNKMTPETKGRFCTSCEKTVIDFSLMTDNEVLGFLSKNTGHICGKFDREQLQRPLIETQLQPRKNWKYWLASVSALFLLGNRSSARVGEQNTYKYRNAERISEDTVPSNQTTTKGRVIADRLLEGVVTDNTKIPLENTSISIKGLDIRTSTDIHGRFSLKTNNLPDTFTLVISYVGFETKKITICKSQLNPLNIQLKLIDGLMGEVVIVKRVKKHQLISTNNISKVFKKEAFSVYPNPITRNGTVNLCITDAGEYDIQFLDNNSTICHVQKSTTTTPKEVVNINLPVNINSGIYYVRLINTATKKQWVDKLIVQ